MKTLVLADNQDVTCIGIETVWQLHGFGAGKGLRVFSEKELSEALLENRDAVVVLDYTLFDCTAEQLFVLKERFSGIHFILFSDSLSEDFVRRMVCGREGFSVLLKDSSLEEIKACFAAALEGRLFVCEKVSSWLYAKEKVKEEVLPLTSTEKEILRAMALGKSTKGIASERFLSVYTVMTHRKNIFRKLCVNNAHEAIRYALRAGLVDIVEYYI